MEKRVATGYEEQFTGQSMQNDQGEREGKGRKRTEDRWQD